MQGFLKPYQVEQIKKKYSIGTRLQIDRIEDIVPELSKKERVFDFMKLFSQMENTRER